MALRSASPPVGSARTSPQTKHFTRVAGLLKIICSFLHLLHFTRRKLLLGPSLTISFTSALLELKLFNSETLSYGMLPFALHALVPEVKLSRGFFSTLWIWPGKSSVTPLLSQKPSLVHGEFSSLSGPNLLTPNLMLRVFLTKRTKLFHNLGHFHFKPP